MSQDGATAMDWKKDGQSTNSTGNGMGNCVRNGSNGVVYPPYASHRLRLNPSVDHKPDNYDDLQLDFSPLLFSSLERYLPPALLNSSRDQKVHFMREILLRYFPEGERTRVQKHREYRQKIISNYQPLHRELYTMHAQNFFVPSFLKAISENSEESFRNIMSEPSPGVFTFEMLQPRFCEMLLAEVENFERWVRETKFRIMRPNTMNRFGAVLDDFGLDAMLEKLMEDFIRPISRVFFTEVGGSTLDSHHGFVVEYGMDRDVDLGFHVDDSEVTLNVCLGKQFSGGELFFRGVRPAYIIYGKNGKYTANIDLETTQAGFSFVCPTGDTCSLGSAVDGVGDINGDGVDDILIGDDGHYRVYGFYGKKNRVDTSLTVDSSLDSTKGFVISTTSYAEYFGEILSSAGDFNNDGIKDIIIGTTSKGAFVYYGRKENWESFDIDTNPETLRIKDSLSGIRPAFGIAVYGGGDVNGDGVDDILIRGEYVAVLYGSKTRKTGTFDMATDLTVEEGLKISSSDFNWQTHSASIEKCITIGDMDNDKIDDIIVGAPIAERFAGRAYIVFGTNGCPKHCSTCEGTKCLTCSGGYGLYESTCGECPAGTSLTDTGICQIGGMSSCSSDGKDTQNAVFKGLFDGTSAVSNAVVLGSSMATNFGLVAKMMRNSQYLDIAMSDNLQETFCTWKVSTGIFPAPKSDDTNSGTLPWVFGRYGMKKAFLVNYWKTFTIILLGLAVGIAGFIITKITLKEDSKIPKILVMMTSNFVLAQFYVSVDDIFLFFVLDARSRESASSSFRTFAFILGILLLLVGFVITGLHGAMMSKLQYSFKKSKKLKLLFADYKETRNFLFINVVRSLISSFIFAMLFEHPLAQIPLLMVLNLCVLVFLFVGKPFKDQINAYAQYCCEGLLFVSYLAILVLASMKKSGKGSEKSIKGWGMVLVVCNAMLLLGTVIFMLFKIFRALKTYKEEHDKSLHSKIEVVPVSLDSTQKLGESPLIRPISLNLSQTASTTFLPETGSSPTLGPKRRTLKVKSHKMTESPPFRPEESQSHTISGNFMLNSHLASERIQEESPMNEEETHRQENSPAGGRREDIHSRLNRMKLQRLRGSNL